MTHVELPVKPDHHVTLVHFHQRLNDEQGQIVLAGLDSLVELYGRHLVDMYWGFPIMVGPPGNQRPASGIEFGTDALVELQRRLKDGLVARGLPVSQTYGGDWLPHVTNPPAHMTPWSVLRPKGSIDLVQGSMRVPVPLPPPVA